MEQKALSSLGHTSELLSLDESTRRNEPWPQNVISQTADIGTEENQPTREERRKLSKALRNLKYRETHGEEIARYRREYELKNKEELARKRSERYLRVRDSVLEKKHAYYKRNREKILAQKKAAYDRDARLAYYSRNRERLLEQKRANYDRVESTQRHRIWRENVYSDPERAKMYRQKRRESVIKSLGKKAGVFLIEKGRSAPMLGTGYVPSMESFLKDPDRAIMTAYRNFDVLCIFRTAERRAEGKRPHFDFGGLPLNEAIKETRSCRLPVRADEVAAAIVP